MVFYFDSDTEDYGGISNRQCDAEIDTRRKPLFSQ